MLQLQFSCWGRLTPTLPQMETEWLALQRLQNSDPSAGSSPKFVHWTHYWPAELTFFFKCWQESLPFLSLYFQFLFKNWKIRHHCPQPLLRMVCWSWPGRASPVTGSCHPPFSPRLNANCCLVAFFCCCCYFSEIRVKRKEIFLACLSLSKEGNENRPEEQVFLTQACCPHVEPLQPLLSFELVSFLTRSTTSACLGLKFQGLKLFPGRARITKPLPHIRTAAISQMKPS